MDYTSDLIFFGYKVDNILFKRNDFFSDREIEIDAKYGYKISKILEKPNQSNISIRIILFENAAQNDYPFEMVVELTGYFEAEKIDSFVTNSVAILFPYLRAIVSTYTALANITPLILPPINILKLIEGLDGENKD